MVTETERLTVRVSGRVQGVGFRAFTTRRAQQLELDGWVRNEEGGTVLLTAEGPRERLEQLLQSVHRGPSMARVEDVTAHWEKAKGEFDGFSVRY